MGTPRNQTVEFHAVPIWLFPSSSSSLTLSVQSSRGTGHVVYSARSSRLFSSPSRTARSAMPREALRRSSRLRDLEDGLVHLPRAFVDAVDETRARCGVARALEAHVAGGDGGVGLRGVLEAVGADRRAALAQRDVAGGGDGIRLVAGDVVGRKETHRVALDPRWRRGEPSVEPQGNSVVGPR